MLTMNISFISSTCMFAIIHYSGYSLTLHVIFSSIQMIESLKIQMVLFIGFGISMVAEL